MEYHNSQTTKHTALEQCNGSSYLPRDNSQQSVKLQGQYAKVETGTAYAT
jgi:hypothetical protein